MIVFCGIIFGLLAWYLKYKEKTTPLPFDDRTGNIIEGIFFRYPTDPSAFVVAFFSCNGEEYFVSDSLFYKNKERIGKIGYFDFENDLFSDTTNTFEISNAIIGCEIIHFHGYEPGASRMVCNVIKEVEDINKIEKCNCEKYFGKERSLCYYYFEREKLDETICLEAGEKSGICYCELAKMKKDERFCEQAMDFKDNCYFQLAQIKRNESLCEKINWQRVKDNCYFQMALLKNDMSLCEKIIKEQWFKDKCYSQLQKE